MPLFGGDDYSGAAGEISVVREPRTGLWLMTHGPPASVQGKTSFPQGVVLRRAPEPWGPWGSTEMTNPATDRVESLSMSSEPRVMLYDLDRDRGLANIVHYEPLEAVRPQLAGVRIGACLSIRSAPPRNFDARGDDALGDEWIERSGLGGGAYGGYMVPSWFRLRTTEIGNVLDVVYTLGTGNPYQVTLMSTSFRLASSPTDIRIVRQRPTEQWEGG